MGTATGTGIILHYLTQSVAGLKIGSAEGTLLSELQINTITWQSDETAIEIESVHVHLNWECIWRRQLCITSLNVQHPVIVTKKGLEPKSSMPLTISSPVPIKIDKIDLFGLNFVQKIVVEGAESKHLNLTIDTIKGNKLLFSDELDLRYLGIGSIAVQRSQNESTDNLNTQLRNVLSSIKSWQYSPPKLSELKTPIPIHIHEFDIHTIKDKQAPNPIFLERLNAGLVVSESQWRLKINQLEWQQWQFSAEAKIKKNLELNILFNAHFDPSKVMHTNPAYSILTKLNEPLSLEVAVSGSLQHIELFALLQDGNQKYLSELELDVMPKHSQLPINAKLKWASLPTLEGQFWHFPQGELKVEGDLSKYSVTLNTENTLFSSMHTPVNLNASFSMNADSNVKKVNLNHINVSTSLSEIRISGQVFIDKQPLFVLEFGSNKIVPMDWIVSEGLEQSGPEANLGESYGQFSDLINSFVITPKGRFTGKWNEDKNWHVSGIVDITGEWNNYPLKVSNEFTIRNFDEKSGQWQIDLNTLQMQLADNFVSVKGHLVSDSDTSSYRFKQFETDIRLTKLEQLLPGSRGEFEGQFAANGNFIKPDIKASVLAQDVAWFDLTLNRMSLDLNLDWQDEGAFKLAGAMSGLKISDALLLDGELLTQGDLSEHKIQLHSTSDKLTAQLDITGGFTGNIWRGNLSRGRVSHFDNHFLLDTLANIEFQLSPLDVSIDPHCWQQGLSALCFEQLDISENRLLANATGKELPVFQWLNELYPSLNHQETNSLLNFTSALDWPFGFFPDANLSLSLSPGQWRFNNVESTIVVDTLKSNIKLQNQKVSAEFILQGPELGGVDMDIAWSSSAKLEERVSNNTLPLLDKWLAKSTLKGRLNASKLSLKSAAQWIPNVQYIEGLIDGSVEIESHWPSKISTINAKPVINGELQLSSGTIVTEQFGLHFSNLNQRLHFDRQEAEMEGDFSLGGGDGKVIGKLMWQHEIEAMFNVTGNALGYQDYSGSVLTFSPDIVFSVSDYVAKVEGEVAIPSADIEVQQLPESVILPSADVHTDSQYSNADVSSLPLEISFAINIDGEKTKQVRLEGYGLKTALTGNLMLSGSPEKLALNGDIILLDGSYQAWGQQLLIREGQIIFSGPMQAPYLFTEAIRNPEYIADNVLAGLRIEGPIRKPSVSIFSQPELTQSQTLSYLLRGKGLNAQLEDSNEIMFTGMLLNFGLSRSESRVTRIGQKFGVQDLAVELSGQSIDTKVAVSGTVLPGLKLSYGVGVFDAISEVSLRYQLLPQLYLEAVSGLTSTIDIHYEFDDDPKPVEQEIE